MELTRALLEDTPQIERDSREIPYQTLLSMMENPEFVVSIEDDRREGNKFYVSGNYGSTHKKRTSKFTAELSPTEYKELRAQIAKRTK